MTAAANSSSYFAAPTELDVSAEQDLGLVTDMATALIDSMWCSKDLTELRDKIAARCHFQPVRMAQAFMVLAAWQNPDETTWVRSQRADYLAAARRAMGFTP